MNFKDLKQVLNEFSNNKIVFVGLGNPQCGDDRAGQLLLERMSKRSEFNGAGFIFAGTNPENYLGKIIGKQPDAVVFIDTARFNAAPGTIQLLDADKLSPTDFSTHTFSIEMVADFIASERPCQFFYLGIEPTSTGIGQPLTEIIENSLQRFFLN